MKNSSQRSRGTPKPEKKEDSDSQKLTLEDYLKKPEDILLPNETRERKIGGYQLVKESERRGKNKSSAEEELIVDKKKAENTEKPEEKIESVKVNQELKDSEGSEEEEEKVNEEEFEVVDEKDEEDNEDSEKYENDSFEYFEGKPKETVKEESEEEERVNKDGMKISVIKEESERKEVKKDANIEKDKLRIEAFDDMRSDSRHSSRNASRNASRNSSRNSSFREYKEVDVSIASKKKNDIKPYIEPDKNTISKPVYAKGNESKEETETKPLQKIKNSEKKEKIRSQEEIPQEIEDHPQVKEVKKVPNVIKEEVPQKTEEKPKKKEKKKEKPQKVPESFPDRKESRSDSRKTPEDSIKDSSDKEVPIKLSELTTIISNSDIPKNPSNSSSKGKKKSPKPSSPQNTPKSPSRPKPTSVFTQTSPDPSIKSSETYQQIIKSQKKELKNLRKALTAKTSEIASLSEKLSISKSKKKSLKSQLAQTSELQKSYQAAMDSKEKAFLDLQQKLNVVPPKPVEVIHRKNVRSESDFWSLEEDSNKSEMLSLKDIAKNKALWIIKTEEKNKGFLGPEKQYNNVQVKQPFGKLKFTRRSLEPLTPKYS